MGGFLHLLQYVSPVWHNPIRLPRDYGYIDKLTFFTTEDHIEQIANEASFVTSIARLSLSRSFFMIPLICLLLQLRTYKLTSELTYKIYQHHKEHMIFAVSSSNRHFKNMDHTAIIVADINILMLPLCCMIQLKEISVFGLNSESAMK